MDLVAEKALQIAYCRTSTYNSVVCIGYHAPDMDGISELAYIPTTAADLKKLKLKENCDYYITANTLTKRERKSENLFSLQNIVIDVDCHNSTITEYGRQEILDSFLWRMNRDCDIPQPNIIHYTGRGLQLWWCLEEVSKSLLWLYKIATQRLIDRLNALQAEYMDFDILSIDSVSKNPIGFFRLFGSHNTKANTQGIVHIQTDHRYDLNNLLTKIEIVEQETKPVQTRTIKNTSSQEYSALNYKRAKFLEWLIESRNAPINTENRDKILFLYYNARVQIENQEQAKESTQKLNEQFKEPLQRVENIFSYINKRGYLSFKNQTWLDFLGLTESERCGYTMQEPKSNYSRDQKRKLLKEERNQTILKMRKEGKTKSEISKSLGIAPRTVYNVLQSLNYVDDRKSKIEEYRAKGLKVSEIIKLLGISKQTYYNILKK